MLKNPKTQNLCVKIKFSKSMFDLFGNYFAKSDQGLQYQVFEY
jgi:hypothetical protein